MPAAAAPIDYFERALAEAAIGGAGLSVRLRLAQLRREFEARDIEPDDPRIPAYIAAILPQSSRPDGGPAQSWRENNILVAPDPAGRVGIQAKIRHFRWRRALKLALPILLCFVVAPNIVRLPTAFCPVDCQTFGVNCPKPSTAIGIWKERSDVQIQQFNPLFYYALAAILLLGILTWIALRMRVYRLQKDSDPDVEPTMNLAVRLGRAHLFVGADMEKLMRLLRLRRNVTSRRIDVKASLRATISQGGFPIFRFGVNRIRPEYLILSEREMIGDHLPEIGRALHARMAAAQVDAWHYEFQGVPNSLRHDHVRNRHGFESVETVKRRHSDARAFLCAESFDIASGLRRNASWVEAVVGEQQPLLLNPRSKEHWHDPENDFLHAGFGSLYAGELDARHYAGFLAQGASNGKTAAYAAEDECDLPAFLAEDRDLLLSPMPIAAQEVEAIVANLAHWLDSTEMTWLRTIALFPLLHPGFTHFSGLILSEGKGMDAGRYLKIARLPWLRAGFMPDWLRQALVQGMGADEFTEAKSTIQSFFAPEAQRARSADDFIAVHEKEKSKRRKNRFEKRLARSAIPALSDTLLINAFASSAPEDVSLDLPDRRRRRWYENALVQAAALTAAGGVLLLWLGEPTFEKRIPRSPIWLPSNLVPEKENPTPPNPDVANTGSQNGGTTTKKNPIPVPVPKPTDLQVTLLIANRTDSDAALRAVAGMGGFLGRRLVFGSPVYSDYSPSETEVRCFRPEDCQVAAVLASTLAGNGIKASVRDMANTRSNYGQRALEIRFANNAFRKEVPPPVICVPGPYIVYFDWDRTDITPQAAQILSNAADQYSKGCNGAQVMLAGHTDREGSTAYNVGKSQRMVNSVRAFLEKSGIPGSRISTESFGESRPLVETADGVREPQNRRVEITFGPPSGAQATAN